MASNHGSTAYIIRFAGAVCAVCAVVVSASAVVLRPMQETNKVLDRQRKVLSVAGLMGEGTALSNNEVKKLFEESIEVRVVELKTGQYDKTIDAGEFDQREASKDPARSRVASANSAKVLRVPNHGLVYRLVENGEVQKLILPVEGKGLWGTLYGFLAIDTDIQTIRGLTFYEHKETPGLGGEVDNPRWKALWDGRKIYGDDGSVQIEVVKGVAGPVAEAPYEVDGLSGATITSRGVTYLLDFWLGDEGFGPYLERFKAEERSVL